MMSFYSYAGKGFAGNNRMSFSTNDRDLDMSSDRNCAVKGHGAWWYSSCTVVNLNGLYVAPGTICEFPGALDGFCGHLHYTFDKKYALRTSSMMIRRK
jgi:hypothetical protein